MEHYINDNVLFVQGIYNGAIYNFNTNHIFSLNHEATICLSNYISTLATKNPNEETFIASLKASGLLQDDSIIVANDNMINIDTVISFAWLEVTNSCNLRCLHCYEGSQHVRSKNHLSKTEWQCIIRQLWDCGCRKIQFIGGEPTDYEYIIDLIDFAVHCGFDNISIFTNATRISPQLLESLKVNNINVHVSLYGHTPKIHDHITQKRGSFEKTIKNIQLMLSLGISVDIAITFMKENEEYYDDIRLFVDKLGVKYYKHDIIRKIPGNHMDGHCCTRKEVITTKYRTAPRFIADVKHYRIAKMYNTCWYGKIAVSENGDVFPCIFSRDIILGNLKHENLQNLQLSQKFQEAWTLDFSKIEQCQSCEFRYACKDCRPLGISMNNKYAKNPRCLYNPNTGIWNDINDVVNYC